MLGAITKLLKETYNMVVNQVKIAYVSKFIKDDAQIPVVQVAYFGSLVGDATIIMPYGTSCGLPEDTLGILLNMLGDETNKLFIPISTTKREKNLKKGEYVAGNQVKKTYIKFLENGNIEIEGKGDIEVKTTGNVNIESQRVNLNSGGTLKKIALDGDTVSGGQIVATGNNYST